MEISNEITTKSHYSSTDISPDVHTFAVRMYNVLHSKGMTQKEYISIMVEAGYQMSERTFRRHIISVNTIGTALSNDKRSGTIGALTEEEKAMVVDYISDRNSSHLIVNGKHYQEYVKSNFNKDISLQTCYNYMEEAGFSSRSASGVNSKSNYTNDELFEMYWNWIKESRRKGIFTCRGDRLCSIDFTYTSHRSNYLSTFAPKNTPQPKIRKLIPRYTNCIVTVIFKDGINRMPSMLFTYNPLFKSNSSYQNENVEWLSHCLDFYEIEKERIVYLENDTNKSLTYVREDPSIIRQFFSHYSIPKNCTILSDGGSAFFDGSEDVLLSLGFSTHETYPSELHHLLSPNDNRVHGTSKRSWKFNVDDHGDDVNASLYLLSCLDSDISTHGAHWFNKNLINPTSEYIGELLGIGGLKKSNLVHQE